MTPCPICGRRTDLDLRYCSGCASLEGHGCGPRIITISLSGRPAVTENRQGKQSRIRAIEAAVLLILVCFLWVAGVTARNWINDSHAKQTGPLKDQTHRMPAKSTTIGNPPALEQEYHRPAAE